MRAFRFIASNIMYIAWFAIYLLIARIILGDFIQVALIYGATISFALSTPGEMLLRILENCREPATEEETSYLTPIFEEVLESAKEIDPNLDEEIELLIKDVMYVDSFAVGKKTIVITKGVIETFTADELKGIISREFGNLSSGHTKAKLLTRIGNFFFTVSVWFFKLLLNILLFINNIVAIRGIKGMILTALIYIARFLFDMNIFIFITVSEIMLAINSQANESEADIFAHKMGYGRELISALYLLQKISITGEASLLERAKATHPHIAFRIRDLESLENMEIAEVEE